MSWDVLLLKAGPEITTLAQLPDQGGDPLGSTDEVRRVLTRILPTLDISDPSWAILEGPDYSIEFSIGVEEPCRLIMLHIRGMDNAIEPIHAVCSETGWRAFDCSTGEIDFSADPARGLRAWREIRDKSVAVGPLKGICLTAPDGKRVFFDALQPQDLGCDQKAKCRRWWQFWKHASHGSRGKSRKSKSR